jgi:multidrug efflux pump subunit AcrA (membrane-fusion protein)
MNLPRVIVRARFAGDEFEWNGRIDRTEGMIDPETRQVHAIARVDDPYAAGPEPDRPPLAVGMFVEAEIIGRTSAPVAVLPRTALRGGDTVLVVDEDDRLRFRNVVVYREERDRVLLSEGVTAGDRIVSSPLENAVDGMRVRTPETETSTGPAAPSDTSNEASRTGTPGERSSTPTAPTD